MVAIRSLRLIIPAENLILPRGAGTETGTDAALGEKD
jgi:hypothetical protein